MEMENEQSVNSSPCRNSKSWRPGHKCVIFFWCDPLSDENRAAPRQCEVQVLCGSELCSGEGQQCDLPNGSAAGGWPVGEAVCSDSELLL